MLPTPPFIRTIVVFLTLSTWTNAISPGCAKGLFHDLGFNDDVADHSMNVGGFNRTWGIWVPATYNLERQFPRRLIFDYHGNGGTPRQQWNNSQYWQYAEGEEYLVVYPAGYNGSWQSAPYAVPGVDDLNFTTTLLGYIMDNYCVDENYVYASGKSNGGGFVDYLACSSNGDEFAAFAMAAAALYSDNSLNDGTCGNKSRAILESHGLVDGTIPYGGGSPRKNAYTPNIQTWAGWWAQRDCGTPIAPVVNNTNINYQIFSYSCQNYTDVVQHYEIYNLGHCWPSSSGHNNDGARSTCTDHSLDFTPVVLSFFNQWNLTNAPRPVNGSGT